MTGVEMVGWHHQLNEHESEQTLRGSEGQGSKKQRHYFATKIHLVKAMVFPVVMYGYESWTIKKAEC